MGTFKAKLIVNLRNTYQDQFLLSTTTTTATTTTTMKTTTTATLTTPFIYYFYSIALYLLKQIVTARLNYVTL